MTQQMTTNLNPHSIHERKQTNPTVLHTIDNGKEEIDEGRRILHNKKEKKEITEKKEREKKKEK